MGFWALQVGHHEAWISTRIDLPSFCAASKACRVNGCSSPANADAEVNRAAAVAAFSRNRRVIMANLACAQDVGSIAEPAPARHTTTITTACAVALAGAAL